MFVVLETKNGVTLVNSIHHTFETAWFHSNKLNNDSPESSAIQVVNLINDGVNWKSSLRKIPLNFTTDKYGIIKIKEN